MMKHMTFLTRWQTFLVLLMLSIATSQAAEEDCPERAMALNKEVDVLLSRLVVARDTSTYYYILKRTMETALQCDQYDRMPNNKGKVNLKYRRNNSKRLAPLRARLIDAGMYYYHHHRSKEALEVLKTYLNLSNSGLFKERKDLYKGQVTYYLSLLSYGEKNYAEADRYADMALRDAEYAKDAAEVKISCMKEMMVTSNDSARYVLALLELHDKAPDNPTYLRLLLEHFSLPGHEAEMEQFAKDEVGKKPQSKQAWALLGEMKMRGKKWSDAEKAYTKAIELDTSYVEAIYNKGICLSAQVQQVLQNIETQNSSLPDSMIRMLREAQKSFERVQQYDPRMKEMDWATPLYLVYKLLGENDQAEAIAPKIDNQDR